MDVRFGLEEGWAPKNRCFWTVVLEKTLESPLDYKEIQPVHSKDQSWVFFGRNDAKADWPPHVKSWLIGKDSDAGRDWGTGGEGDNQGWDGWMASRTRRTWVWVNSGRWWWTGRPGELRLMGSQRVGHDWATKLKLKLKGTFHAKMGTIKGRNGMNLTEAEDIKKRWQEYTEELYKKDLHDPHDPDNDSGVITHLEPDILECQVKWASWSITMNKASEVMKFQLSYFKSWKMMLWKCCTQYASKFGKLSSGHRTGKGQFSFQSQRKAMQKNAQTTAQLYSSHTLAK